MLLKNCYCRDVRNKKGRRNFSPTVFFSTQNSESNLI
nr:MAG TPA: hypothetical protein [Caudoviricetes sp.]